MIDLLEKIIRLLEKLNSYFQKRYPKDTGFYVPESARRTQLQRFGADVSAHSLPLLALLLASLIVIKIVALIRYDIFLYKINTTAYPKFVDIFNQLKYGISFVILLLVVIIAYILIRNRHNQAVMKTSAIIYVALGILSILSITSSFEKTVNNYIQTSAYYFAYQAFWLGEYKQASDIFKTLEDGVRGDSQLQPGIDSMLSQSNLNAGNVKESVAGFAQLVSRGSHLEDSPEVVLLHTSIYALGKSVPLDDAMKFIEDLQQQYNLREISPIWLGLEPKINLHFLRDYVVLIEANAEDRSLLRLLIVKYPDDYYANLARLAIGECRSVVNQPPSTPLLDWCIYKTAQESYEKQDLENSIKYFSLFLQSFSGHRWTDDAVYRLARSYDLSGDYETALRLVLLSENFPGEDYMGLIKEYRIALIDNYFTSKDLEGFIVKYLPNVTWNYPPILEYSLAEQYFKDGDLEKAYQQFEYVKLKYPQSKYADLSEKNIQLLQQIMAIKQSSGDNWPIAVAKFVMEPYDFYGNYDNYQGLDKLIIYNDLYEGRRINSLSLIGWAGPTWNYYQTANDYLWASNLLSRECGNCSNPDEVLYLQILACYNLTYGNAFLPAYKTNAESLGDISNHVDFADYGSYFILNCLHDKSTQLVKDYPSSQYAPEGLSISAVGHAEKGEYKRSSDIFQMLVNLYPDSSLANNSAIYIARNYHKLASITSGKSLKLIYLQNAKTAYEFTIKNYPTGHVGVEALKELAQLNLEINLLP